MPDYDLAALYEVENRVLKQAVRRNTGRFPEDFMFDLTKKEWEELITICDNLPEVSILLTKYQKKIFTSKLKQRFLEVPLKIPPFNAPSD